MSSLERWIAGVMMCEGRSPRSCTMYSPRSVSTTSHPAAASAGLSAISSVAIDLPLTTRRAPRSRATSTIYLRASAASAATNTLHPLASRRLLELDQQLVEPRDGVLFYPPRGVALGLVGGELGARRGDVIEMASGGVFEFAAQFGVGDRGFARGEEIAVRRARFDLIQRSLTARVS